MNNTDSEYLTGGRFRRIINYLASETPRGRYQLFFRSNIFIFAGYLIATIETLLAIFCGFTLLTYGRTFLISVPILIVTLLLTFATYKTRIRFIWQEIAIFLIYLFTYLIAFSLWVYWLGELRFLGILNGITAVTIVLSYTNAVQSLMMSLSTLICYYAVVWYSIRIALQPGSILKETFLSFCLLPAFMLISSAANYMNKKRAQFQKAKNDLEKLNRNLMDVNDALVEEQQQTVIEMDLAGQIQRAIFFSSAPPTKDWEIAFISKPYEDVSGDFYDFYVTGDKMDGIALFDVSGHGVAPALVSILAKPVLYFQFIQNRNYRLQDVIEYANSRLMGELEAVNLYITGILLRMNGNEVEYVNAGHPDLIFAKSSTGEVRVITDKEAEFKGPPIGITSEKMKCIPVNITVENGDFLILYSDGLIEGRNNSNQEFGLQRLKEVIATSQQNSSYDMLKSIMESVDKFTGGLDQADDITLIVAKKI